MTNILDNIVSLNPKKDIKKKEKRKQGIKEPANKPKMLS
jgi:hypothetical protein